MSLCCLLFFEGQGIAALEAMSCGKPVVAFNIGGIPEVVEDSKTGFLVKPYSIKDFSRSIIKLLKDRELGKAMGIEGRKVVEQKFQWKNIARQLINVLRCSIFDYSVIFFLLLYAVECKYVFIEFFKS